MKSGSPSRTTAAHKTQTKIQAWSSLSSTVVTPHLTLPKLLRGTRDRWVAQVSFITNYSTGLAPFPRLSAPPHSSQWGFKLSRQISHCVYSLSFFMSYIAVAVQSHRLLYEWSVLSGRVLVMCFWKNSPSDEMSFVCSLSCCSKPVEICLSFTFWLWSRGMWFDVFSAHDDWGCVSISSLVQ